MLPIHIYQRLQRTLFHGKTFFNCCQLSLRSSHQLRTNIEQRLHDTNTDSVNFTFDKSRRVVVYTDGCFHFNNTLDKKKQKSGIGVYWGKSDHPLNLAMPIYDENASLHRAELLAAHAAVHVAIKLSISELCLRVGSIYVKKGCEKWLQQWQSNGWLTSEGTPVQNQDLWKPLADDLTKVKIKFQKVNSKGQKMAYDLADCAACQLSLHSSHQLHTDIKQLLQDTNMDKVNFTFDQKQRVVVNTDGCCYNQNTLDMKNRKSGIGVYWGKSNHPLNVSMPIYDKNVSSNRAELLAVHAAVRIAIELGVSELCLRVDSRYVMTGCEKWLQKWQSNGWRTSNGTPVKNQDLWKPLANDLPKVDIEFQKVNDKTSKDQKMAHDLANSAAAMLE